jgi:hypothetical protein
MITTTLALWLEELKVWKQQSSAVQPGPIWSAAIWVATA